MSLRIPTLLVLLLVTACGEPPAPPDPGTQAVELVVQGRAGPPLVVTGPRPLDFPPDRERDGRRAWRLATLFGHRLDAPEAVLEVLRVEGDPVSIPAPGGRPEGSALWIEEATTGRWRVIEGREAGKIAVEGVSRLRLHLPGGGKSTATQAPFALEIHAGDSVRAIRAEDLEALRPVALEGGGHGGSDEAWPLRDLVRETSGRDARLLRVRSAGGAWTSVSQAAWEDEAVRPVLQVNRRGALKLVWLDAVGRPAAEPETVREVDALEVERR